MPKSRRVRRSQNVLTAMSYQLDACREEADLEAMVVSDDSGLCVASAGREDTCEELAARLPIIGRNAPEFGGILLSGSGGLQMVVRSFEVGGQPLYLCVVGKPHAKLERTIKRSIQGVSRILAVA